MRATAFPRTGSPRPAGPVLRLLCLLLLVVPGLVGTGILVQALPRLLRGATWQEAAESPRALESLLMLLCLSGAALLCLGWGLLGLWAASHALLRGVVGRKVRNQAPGHRTAALPRMPRALRRTVWILVGAQAALALPGMPAQARTSSDAPVETTTLADEVRTPASHGRDSAAEEGQADTSGKETLASETVPSASTAAPTGALSPLFGATMPESAAAVSVQEADHASTVSVLATRGTVAADQLSPLFGGTVPTRATTPAQDDGPGGSAARESSPPSDADSREWVVLRGQTLWSIAAATLPSDASSAEVARAVGTIYDHNRDVLVDGPDLILPGMVLDLTGT